MREEEAVLRKKMIGVLLRYARLRANLTVRDVSEATGYSANAIADHEYGRADLSLNELEVFAYLYHVPIAYFWNDGSIVEEEVEPLNAKAVINLRRRIIGTLLRQARTEGGYTESDLADTLGCDVDHIYSFESGEIDVPLTKLETLAWFLGVPMSYFFDQGIKPQGEQIADMDELEQLSDLPEDIRKFILQPNNLLYVRLAMKLSSLPASSLRKLGEGLMEITH
jgi:transcriptional regulator with XRE-family HTH domain